MLKTLVFSVSVLCASALQAADLKIPKSVHCDVEGQITLTALAKNEVTNFSTKLMFITDTYIDHIKIKFFSASEENIRPFSISARLLDPTTRAADPYIYRPANSNDLGCVGANKSNENTLIFNQSCSGNAVTPGGESTLKLRIDSFKLNLATNEITGLSSVSGEMFNPVLNRRHDFTHDVSYDGVCEII